MDKEKVIIFDTTLRDGEQVPGASLNIEEKVRIAHQLARLGVDVIEAGFPISSPGDFEAVKRIAKEVKGPVIAALGRAVKKDINAVWESIKYAHKPRIHIVLGTSDIHIKGKFGKTRKEIFKIGLDALKYAKSLTRDVEYSTEDASRSDFNYLCEVIQAVIEAGATVVNIPDTVGYAMPQAWGELIYNIRQRVSNINKAILSVHCHNDLGLATANTLAAIANGAQQVECTINGIGERAGNASLEEIVMSLKVREDCFHRYTDINTREIYNTSRMVSNLMGIQVQPNKSIVGSNAFAHSSGIHQDGVLKYRPTYEIMKPEEVGVKESKIVLTARSGRHALKHKLAQLGYRLNRRNLEKVHEKFLRLADKKKEVFDEDLQAIIEEELKIIPKILRLEYLHVTTGNRTVPTATVRIEKKGKIIQEASCGDGPVDATYKAIDRVTKIPVSLIDYSLKAVTRGKDALGEVNVKVEDKKGRLFSGRGLSTDVIEASALAYINAINKIFHKKQR